MAAAVKKGSARAPLTLNVLIIGLVFFARDIGICIYVLLVHDLDPVSILKYLLHSSM